MNGGEALGIVVYLASRTHNFSGEGHAGAIKVDWLGAALIGAGLGAYGSYCVELMPDPWLGCPAACLVSPHRCVRWWRFGNGSGRRQADLPLEMFPQSGWRRCSCWRCSWALRDVFAAAVCAPCCSRGLAYRPRAEGVLVSAPLVIGVHHAGRYRQWPYHPRGSASLTIC
ncbi:hypothetical protein ACU4GD_36900 [Cupriavidus basilensis]